MQRAVATSGPRRVQRIRRKESILLTVAVPCFWCSHARGSPPGVRQELVDREDRDGGRRSRVFLSALTLPANEVVDRVERWSRCTSSDLKLNPLMHAMFLDGADRDKSGTGAHARPEGEVPSSSGPSPRVHIAPPRNPTAHLAQRKAAPTPLEWGRSPRSQTGIAQMSSSVSSSSGVVSSVGSGRRSSSPSSSSRLAMRRRSRWAALAASRRMSG